MPYQPPIIQHHEIFIGMAHIVAGPSLPPEMIWKRSFQNLMFDFTVKEVPRSIFFKPLGTVTYSKHTWSIAFDESKKMSLLVANLPSSTPLRKSVVIKCPVATVLFEELPDAPAPVSEDALPADSGEISQSSTVVFYYRETSQGEETEREEEDTCTPCGHVSEAMHQKCGKAGWFQTCGF